MNKTKPTRLNGNVSIVTVNAVRMPACKSVVLLFLNALTMQRAVSEEPGRRPSRIRFQAARLMFLLWRIELLEAINFACGVTDQWIIRIKKESFRRGWEAFLCVLWPKIGAKAQNGMW